MAGRSLHAPDVGSPDVGTSRSVVDREAAELFNDPAAEPLAPSRRKALDTWGPSPVLPVAAAIRDAHAGGLRVAVKLLRERGEPVLAMEIQKLAEDVQTDPVLRGRAP